MALALGELTKRTCVLPIARGQMPRAGRLDEAEAGVRLDWRGGGGRGRAGGSGVDEGGILAGQCVVVGHGLLEDASRDAVESEPGVTVQPFRCMRHKNDINPLSPRSPGGGRLGV